MESRKESQNRGASRWAWIAIVAASVTVTVPALTIALEDAYNRGLAVATEDAFDRGFAAGVDHESWFCENEVVIP